MAARAKLGGDATNHDAPKWFGCLSFLSREFRDARSGMSFNGFYGPPILLLISGFNLIP